MSACKRESGFTLIEVLIALGIFSVVVVTLLPIVSWLISRSTYLQYDAQASLLAQEGMEISYNLAVTDWENFVVDYPDGIYHPALDVSAEPDKWTLIPGEEADLEARFSRKISVDPVCRNDMTGEIVSSGCGSGSTLDEKSKYLVTTIRWKELQGDKEIEARFLITDLER